MTTLREKIAELHRDGWEAADCTVGQEVDKVIGGLSYGESAEIYLYRGRLGIAKLRVAFPKADEPQRDLVVWSFRLL